jgi:tetratricopeptide (TPR) repeat protein
MAIPAIYWFLSFTFSLPLSLFAFQEVGQAQEYAGCFLITSSQGFVDLTSLCERGRILQREKTETSQEITRQALRQIRAGELESAISSLDRAINANSNFLEAYLARAYAYSRVGNHHGEAHDYQMIISLSRARGNLTRAAMYSERLENLQMQLGRPLTN